MAVIGIIGQIHGLDDLVGTDYWIRARIRINGTYAYCYIQVLDSQEVVGNYNIKHTDYTIRSIDIRRLSYSDILYCNEETKNNILKGKGITLPEWDIKIIEPIEPIPTEEMFHITDEA